MRFDIGFKGLSFGNIISNGKMHQVKRHERTVLINNEEFIVFDHPASLVRPFVPTTDEWIGQVNLEMERYSSDWRLL